MEIQNERRFLFKRWRKGFRHYHNYCSSNLNTVKLSSLAQREEVIIIHPHAVANRPYPWSELSKNTSQEVSLKLPYLSWLAVESKPTFYMSFQLHFHHFVWVNSPPISLRVDITDWTIGVHIGDLAPWSLNYHQKQKMSVEETSKLKILENMAPTLATWILKINPYLCFVME